MKFLNKKGGVFEDLAGLGTGIAVLAIVLVVTFLIISQGRSQAATAEGLDFSNTTQCESSYTCNATNTLTSAVADVPAWVPLVVIAFIGAIILGLVKLFRWKFI